MLAIRQEDDTSNNFSMSCGLGNHLSSHKVIDADGLVRESADHICAARIHYNLLTLLAPDKEYLQSFQTLKLTFIGSLKKLS